MFTRKSREISSLLAFKANIEESLYKQCYDTCSLLASRYPLPSSWLNSKKLFHECPMASMSNIIQTTPSSTHPSSSNPDGNMKFFSISEAKTTAIVLLTTYMRLWLIKGSSPLRMMRNLRWEDPFRKNSWTQSRHREWQLSFCQETMHLPRGAWKNLQRLLNARKSKGWECFPFFTTWILVLCGIRMALLQMPLLNMKNVSRRT